MTRPSTLSIALLFAGSLDLIFALGFTLVMARMKRAPNAPSPLVRPNRVVPLVLAALGVTTILAGILTWGFKGN